MDLGIIVAVSDNNVIGKYGGLPWHIPEDLKHFKELTMGYPVIMGRKTYESIGQPLTKRKNIVITSGIVEGAFDVVNSLSGAIQLVNQMKCTQAYVIGGKRLYEEALKVADFMEITEVHQEVKGDVYFPKVNWGEWKEFLREDSEDYSFASYKRR